MISGTQSDIWGQAISLHAQLGIVCIFHDALQPTQVKSLYTAGTTVFCHQVCIMFVYGQDFVSLCRKWENKLKQWGFIDAHFALELLYYTKPAYSEAQMSTRSDKLTKK